MALGIIMAVTMAIMRMGTNPILRGVSWAYIWFFRGTPIYTQLVFWGLIGTLYPKIGIGDWSISTQDIYNAAFAAILGLGLNEGAYLAEIVRGGLRQAPVLALSSTWRASPAHSPRATAPPGVCS